MRVVFIFMIVFLIFCASCSDKPTESLDYNVRLNLIFPDDPLLNWADSAFVTVSAVDITSPYETAAAADPLFAGIFPIDLYIPPGPERRFRARLKDIEGRTLFTSIIYGDVFPDRLRVFDLTFSQAGFASGSSVIVFRDQYPWDSPALDSVLIQQGLALGTGRDCYYVYPSSEMPLLELRPGIDLVIISNDQPQEFYDNYAANQDRFESFVRNGGTLLWCACDLGWNYGSIAGSGLELPGSVGISYGLDPVNTAANRDFAILAGLADTLRGNYASQETFTGLPYGTTTYLVNSDGLSTLIGFDLGEGWVIISGQPLEYNYDRRDAYTIGELLSRLISFLLGVGAGEPLSLSPGLKTSNGAGQSGSGPASFAAEGTSRQ